MSRPLYAPRRSWLGSFVAAIGGISISKRWLGRLATGANSISVTSEQVQISSRHGRRSNRDLLAVLARTQASHPAAREGRTRRHHAQGCRRPRAHDCRAGGTGHRGSRDRRPCVRQGSLRDPIAGLRARSRGEATLGALSAPPSSAKGSRASSRQPPRLRGLLAAQLPWRSSFTSGRRRLRSGATRSLPPSCGSRCRCLAVGRSSGPSSENRAGKLAAADSFESATVGVPRFRPMPPSVPKRPRRCARSHGPGRSPRPDRRTTSAGVGCSERRGASRKIAKSIQPDRTEGVGRPRWSIAGMPRPAAYLPECCTPVVRTIGHFC
jgi:hypothetical protein